MSDDATYRSVVRPLLWSYYDWNFVPPGLLSAVESLSVEACERVWQDHVHRMTLVLSAQSRALIEWKSARHAFEHSPPPRKLLIFSYRVSHVVLEHSLWYGSQPIADWALRHHAPVTPRALSLARLRQLEING